MQAELAYFSQSCRPEASVCAIQRHERNNLFLEAVVSERLADAAAVVCLEIHRSVVKVAAAGCGSPFARCSLIMIPLFVITAGRLTSTPPR